MRKLAVILLVNLLFACFVSLPAFSAQNSSGQVEDAENETAKNKPADENEAEKNVIPNPANDAFQRLWSDQGEKLQEIRETALKLSDSFAEQTVDLSRKLQPFEEEGQKFLVMANSYKSFPHPMEAIMWKISATIADLDKTLDPLRNAKAEAQTLIEQVNHMASSIPEDSDPDSLSPEMKDYIQSIQLARLRLTAILTQYNTLLPSFNLVARLEKAQTTINRDLPSLWKNYYLQKPVSWLNPETWENIANNFYYAWQFILLRLPVELPASANLWGACVLRFFIGLLFGGAILIILKRRWLKSTATEPVKNIFNKSAPWIVIGTAFIGSAFSASGDFFRLLLAFGSLAIIIGEIILAWNLRLLQYPEENASKSPFIKFIPLAFWAYLLLYLPFPQPPVLVIWIIILIYSMHANKRWKKFTSSKMQIETGIGECYPIILWPCLFLAVSGLHIYSMALYLAFVALAISLEFSFGGMSIISRINEHLPPEGPGAVLARLGVALAAPCILLLAVAGLGLWVVILPGGTYLLGEYALKGVSIGATQFNIFQILVIISAFYLTRTIVSMGTRFLAKLPAQGGTFSPTFVTPMQTALTYITWAVFALFALHALGMSLSNLAMVAGGLSVGIGFGMQTIVNNFLSGLILIFGRTLQVGDVVDVGGTTGRVRKISVRATMVETYDNAIIYVPNSEFMSNRLTNWTSFSRSVRREIQVGVAYGSDTDLVIRLLIDIAKQHKNVLMAPAPSVNFADFAASSLDFRLRFWVKDYELGAATSSDLRLSINRIFHEHNIEISFPQLDVHLKDMPGSRETNENKPENAPETDKQKHSGQTN